MSSGTASNMPTGGRRDPWRSGCVARPGGAIEVEDQSRWRPARDERQGLGLRIVRPLMRACDVEALPAGTRVVLTVDLDRRTRSGEIEANALSPISMRRDNSG